MRLFVNRRFIAYLFDRVLAILFIATGFSTIIHIVWRHFCGVDVENGINNNSFGKGTEENVGNRSTDMTRIFESGHFNQWN